MNLKDDLPVLLLTLLFVFGMVVPGAVTAQENPSNIDDDQVFEISNDGQIEGWERSLYPLRIDDTDAEVQVPPPHTVQGQETDELTDDDDGGNSRLLIADDSLIGNERNQLGVHNSSKSVDITFDGSRANYDLSGEDNVQVVSARLTPEEGKRLPSTTDDFLDLLSDVDNANANATFKILSSNRSIPDNGEGEFTESETFDTPGQYVVFAAVKENSADGFTTVNNGNISVDGNVVIIGTDQLSIQKDVLQVETPDTPSIGQNLTFGVDANVLSSDSVTHAIALYNTSAFENNANFDFVVNSSKLGGGGDFSFSKDSQLEHNIATVSGKARVEEGTTLNGNDLSDGRVQRPVSADNIIDFLAEEATTDVVNSESSKSDKINKLNASVTAINGESNDTTVNVDTFGNFSTGEYRYVAVSTLDDAESKSQSTTGTINLTSPISSFSVSNPSGQNVEVSFDSEINLTSVEVDISGAEDDTLTGFTNDSDTYSATYGGDSDGSYTATLTTAEDGDGNNVVRNDPSASISVDTQTGGSTDPANFQVSNLQPQSQTITEGGEFDVEATVENTGDEQGTQDIEFTLDGNVEDTQTETLDGGQSTTVTFQDISVDQAGNYDYEISSNDQSVTGSLTVEAPEPANFQVSNLQPQTLTVTEGEEFDVDATIENTGGQQGTQDIEFLLDDSVETTQTETLESGGSTTVTFQGISVDQAGNYDYEIASNNGSVTGDLTVEEPETSNFEVSITEAPNEVITGDNIGITATVENTGDASGTQSVQFLIDGVEEESRSVTLDPTDETTEEFTYSTDNLLPRELNATIKTANTTASTIVSVTQLGVTPLSIEANQTEIVRGETVEFTVTDDTGTPVSATVDIAGTSLEENTGSNGVAAITFDTTGQLSAQASKESTEETNFSSTSTTIDVSEPTLDIGQSAIEFGQVSIGDADTREITVSNPAPSSIAINQPTVSGDNDPFSIQTDDLPDEIAANADQTLIVSFEPAIRDTSEATLNINDQTVSLSGSGAAPELTVDSSLPIEFATDPGTTTTTTVTVSNNGNAPLNASLTSGDRFTNPASINVAAGGTESVDVDFTPQEGDSREITSDLTFSPESDAISETSIPLVGTVIDRDIELQTTGVTVGNTTIGETTTAGVVVENVGTTTETITATTDTTVFGVVGDDGESITLDPGGQAFLTVEATPTDPGEVIGSLTVETDDGEVSDSTTLTATGQAPQIGIESAEPLVFPETSLSSTTTEAIEVSNDGDAALTVAVESVPTGSVFESVGSTEIEVPAGETGSLPIGFSPQTAGETSADLTLSTNDPETPQRTITLQGEGIETAVGLSQSRVSFEATGVSSSTTETVSLENDGSPFTIETVDVSGSEFEISSEVSGTTVAEGDSVPVELTFDPQTGGSKTGTVTISGSTGTNTTTVSAALAGTGQIADLQTSAQTLRTGVTTQDGTTSGEVLVENTGIAGTQLTIETLSLDDTSQFSLGQQGITEGTTIAGQSRESLTVTFDPATTEDGVQETTLTLEASSGEETFTRTISVTGTVSAPEPTVSSDELSIGDVAVGEETTQTVEISNDGGEPFSITNVAADTDGVTAQLQGQSEVVPGDEQTVRIAVNGSTADVGSIDAAVDISTTASSDPSVAIAGTVVAPEFNLGTTTLDFTETPTGSASQQSLTIENTGDAPLTVAPPTISNSDAFSILSGDQRLRIASGGSQTVTIGFSPDTTGEQTATLTVDPRNDPNADTQDITLTGTGTQSDVGLTDSTVGFGTIQSGATQTISVEITNDGSAEAEITGGASVTGANSRAVSVNGLSATRLPSGESESFDIVVDTSGINRGSLSAQVAVPTDEATVTSSVGGTVASPGIDADSSVSADAFGTTRVGDTSTASVTVENTGNAELNLGSISTTGADADAFSVIDRPNTISPASSGQIVVEFDPAALPNAGQRAQNTPLEAAAQLTIDHNAGGTESTSLRGTAETGALSIPQTFQFGDTPVDETTTRQLTVENRPSATAPLTVTDLTVGGDNANAYQARFTDTEAPVSLQPGDSASVNISLTPDSLDRQFATVTVGTDDPRQSAGKIGVSNVETVYTVDYGSVDVQYINPTSGQEPSVDTDRGLRGENATLTQTVSDVNTTTDYDLNYRFGDNPSEVGQSTALQEAQSNVTAVRYMNATTTASSGEFNESTFQMEVSKAVLAQQNATPENVTIYHETDGSYEPLATTRLFETTQGHVYEVTTDTYSVFAVGTTTVSGDDDGGDTGGGDDGDTGGGDDGDTGGGDDGDTGGGGGGGGGGAPPSATDGTGVNVPNISAELGSVAEITAEYEAITVRNEARFPASFPLLASVGFEVEALDDDIQGTVNARAIEGEPATTGSPPGESVAITHLSVPSGTPEKMTIKYNVSQNQLSEFGTTAQELTVYQYADDEWETLETTGTTETGTNAVVTSDTANSTTSYIALSAPATGGDDAGEPSETAETPESTDDGIPGFGGIASLIALLAVALLARHRE